LYSFRVIEVVCGTWATLGAPLLAGAYVTLTVVV
jgi:hypothetical protein